MKLYYDDDFLILDSCIIKLYNIHGPGLPISHEPHQHVLPTINKPINHSTNNFIQEKKCKMLPNPYI